MLLKLYIGIMLKRIMFHSAIPVAIIYTHLATAVRNHPCLQKLIHLLTLYDQGVSVGIRPFPVSYIACTCTVHTTLHSVDSSC